MLTSKSKSAAVRSTLRPASEARSTRRLRWTIKGRSWLALQDCGGVEARDLGGARNGDFVGLLPPAGAKGRDVDQPSRPHAAPGPVHAWRINRTGGHLAQPLFGGRRQRHPSAHSSTAARPKIATLTSIGPDSGSMPASKEAPVGAETMRSSGRFEGHYT